MSGAASEEGRECKNKRNLLTSSYWSKCGLWILTMCPWRQTWKWRTTKPTHGMINMLACVGESALRDKR